MSASPVTTDHQHRPGRRRSAAGVLAAALIVLVGAAGCAGSDPSDSSDSAGSSVIDSPMAPETTASGSSTTTVAPDRSTLTPSEPVASGGEGDVRDVDFMNFTYEPDSCPNGGLADPPPDGIPVRDGLYRSEPSNSVSVGEEIVYGDLTGDGQDEAVVTVMCSTGVGSGTATSTWVFAPDGSDASGVRRLAFPALTDTQLEAVGLSGGYPKGAFPSISDGVLTLEWTVFAPDDVPVFASKDVTTHVEWTGSEWRDAAPPTVTDRPRGG